MLLSSVRTYTDPAETEAAYLAADADIVPTGRDAPMVTAIRVHFSRLWVTRASESAARIRHTTLHPTRAFIVWLTQPGPEVLSNGVPVPPNGLMRLARGQEYYERSTGPMQWATMSLPTEDVIAAGAAIGACDLGPPAEQQVIFPSADSLARLQRLHAAAGNLAQDASELLEHPDVSRALEQSLVEAMVGCFAGAPAQNERWAQRSHELVMRRFWRYLGENSERAVYIPEICAGIRVPERTLRMCCHEHLGMGPKQYLLERRMQLVNRALRTAATKQTTVTEIATRFGFWHFGRFSGTYRRIFGELPSVTLDRTQ